ncbi:MAG: DUF1289 domain-containing protein [Gammaproteobacteria bacterium]|nr:DUF1289 domain-containing protein [Gammaproteobacteria bacterium]
MNNNKLLVDLKECSGSEQAPNSPCIRNCCLNEEDICIGCFRSIDEIMCWSASSTQEKIAILERIQERKKIDKTSILNLTTKNK